jgi:glucose-1-phosphate thymidylyltransferase
MKVLILAAGYGTRLYPHVKRFPKPLLKIGKRPLINYLLDKIEELSGVSRLIVVTNNRFFKQFQAWKNSLNMNRRIELINDLTTSPKNRLGALGDMNLIFKQEGVEEDFLVLGGDNLFKQGLADFLSFAKSKHPSVVVGLSDIKDKKEASHFGVVSLDRNSRIIEFYEKPAEPKSSLVAMCLYYIPKEKLSSIREYLDNPHNSHDTAGTYIKWLSQKDKVYGFEFSDIWFDIGHIQAYKKASQAFAGQEE